MGAAADTVPLAAEADTGLFLLLYAVVLFSGGKILRFFRLSRAGYWLLSVSSAYHAIAGGFFNNDCLLLPLQAGTVYYSLLYGPKKNLARILLFATAERSTKLSAVPPNCAAIAPPAVAAAKKPENGRRLTHKKQLQKNDQEDKRLLQYTGS